MKVIDLKDICPESLIYRLHDIDFDENAHLECIWRRYSSDAFFEKFKDEEIKCVQPYAYNVLNVYLMSD